MRRLLRIGTRGSSLARIQAEHVARWLTERGLEVDIVPIVTTGDVRPIDTAWGEGAFVDALEAALRAGEVDAAVHSAKDVPLESNELDDLIVAAYPVRADPRDALITGRRGRRPSPNGRLEGRGSSCFGPMPRRVTLPASLRAAGALVDDVAAYRTIEGPASSREPLRADLADPDLGCVIVASGSAVRGLVALTDDVAALRDIPLVAIGRPTADVARDAGFSDVHTSASATTDGLLEAVWQSLDSNRLGVPA